MSSGLAVSGALGVQEPRIERVPQAVASSGREMVELGGMFDLHADPWQERVLVGASGERADGRHAAKEVGVVVPRQNGKDGILELRTLGGLLILEERLITYSAHQFDTSLEAFRRLLHFFENFDDLTRRVKRISKSHGEEGIELLSGQRVRFRTRTAGGGRGFTGDCLFLNEAMILRESAMGALFFTLSARPNPQVWYTGSAVDEDVHEHGLVLARVRSRALAGADPALAYFEWSAADDLDSLDPDDRDGWARANPALGVRIREETVEIERRAVDPRTFAVERLGVGIWPSADGVSHVIDPDVWGALEDADSKSAGGVCFTFDTAPDRSMSSIAAVGFREDGLLHVEVVERRPGTRWVPERLAALCEKHGNVEPFCDAAGPAASLIPSLNALGIAVRAATAQEYVRACGLFYDTVADEAGLRHRGQAELAAALKGAAQRRLGDAWAWSRKNSEVDISPLVAITLALWAALEGGALGGGGFEWD